MLLIPKKEYNSPTNLFYEKMIELLFCEIRGMHAFKHMILK